MDSIKKTHSFYAHGLRLFQFGQTTLTGVQNEENSAQVIGFSEQGLGVEENSSCLG